MQFIDDKHEEVIDGWTVSAWRHGEPRVDINGPNEQEAYLDTEEFWIGVYSAERGRVFEGDTAYARTIPTKVIAAAFRIFDWLVENPPTENP